MAAAFANSGSYSNLELSSSSCRDSPPTAVCDQPRARGLLTENCFSGHQLITLGAHNGPPFSVGRIACVLLTMGIAAEGNAQPTRINRAALEEGGGSQTTLTQLCG